MVKLQSTAPRQGQWGPVDGLELPHTVFFPFQMLTLHAMHAGGDCDLVTPQSTIKGKGYWGRVEGLELQLNLTDAGHQFVSNPLNYRRVQVRGTKVPLMTLIAPTGLMGRHAWGANPTTSCICCACCQGCRTLLYTMANSFAF